MCVYVCACMCVSVGGWVRLGQAAGVCGLSHLHTHFKHTHSLTLTHIHTHTHKQMVRMATHLLESYLSNAPQTNLDVLTFFQRMRTFDLEKRRLQNQPGTEQEVSHTHTYTHTLLYIHTHLHTHLLKHKTRRRRRRRRGGNGASRQQRSSPCCSTSTRSLSSTPPCTTAASRTTRASPTWSSSPSE